MESAAITTRYAWSPNQCRSLAIMGVDENLQPIGERPTFDANLPVSLRAQLEELLTPTLDQHNFTPNDPLVVAKYPLGEVFRCETRYVESLNQPFEWTIAKARGTILHKAQQASITRRGSAIAAPVVVEQAIQRLKRDVENSISEWLRELSEFEIEELTVDVTECLVKLRGDLPPIQPHWQPRCESRVRVELCDKRCVLAGKFDLALGMPRGWQARTFVADFKTGGTRLGHHDEMRFYALLETFRSKVPPWRMAVYYVDVGEWSPLDTDEHGLLAAVRRTADGAKRIAELKVGGQPPNPCRTPCSFCAPGEAYH